MDKIVVTGVDGSETATRAVQRAAEVAVASQASLHIVSAYGPGAQRQLADGEGGRMVINLQDEAEGFVTEAAESARAEASNLEVTTATVQDTPADALVSEADRLDALLIVVGNKRVQGPTRILGSIARSVAANARCDIYVANTRLA